MSNEAKVPETRGEHAGRLAFAYCKIAFVSLLCGRFTLPVAAGLSALLFLTGYVQGKRDTKCWAKYPLGIAAFWLLVLALWLGWEFAPHAMPWWTGWLHR